MNSYEITQAASLFAAIHNTQSTGSGRSLESLLALGGSYTGAEVFEKANTSIQKASDYLKSKRLIRETGQGRSIVATGAILKAFEDGKNPKTARAIGKLYTQVVADLAPHSDVLTREGFKDFSSHFDLIHRDILAHKVSKTEFEAQSGDQAPDMASLQKTAKAALKVAELTGSELELGELKATLIAAGIEPGERNRSTSNDRGRLEAVFAAASAFSRNTVLEKDADESDAEVRALMDLKIEANSAVFKPRRVLNKEEARPVFGAAKRQEQAAAEQKVPDRTSLERVVLATTPSLRAMRSSNKEMKGISGYDADKLDELESSLRSLFGDTSPTPSQVKAHSRESLAPIFDAARAVIRPIRLGQGIERDNLGTSALLDLRMSVETSTFISSAEAKEVETGEAKEPARNDLGVDDRAMMARTMGAAMRLVEDGRFSVADMEGSISVDKQSLAALKTLITAQNQMGVTRTLSKTREITDIQSGAKKVISDFKAPDVSRSDAELMVSAFNAMTEITRGDGRIAIDTGLPDLADLAQEEEELTPEDLAEVDAAFGVKVLDEEDEVKEDARTAPKISESSDLNTVATSYEKLKAFEEQEKSLIASNERVEELSPAFDTLTDEDRRVDIEKESYEAMMDAVLKLRDRGTLERIANSAEVSDQSLVAIDEREDPQFGSIEEAMGPEAEYGERRFQEPVFGNIHTHRAANDLKVTMPEAKQVLTDREFSRLSAKEKSFTHAIQIGGNNGPLGDYKPAREGVALTRMVEFVETRKFARDDDGEVLLDKAGNKVPDRHFVETMKRASNPDRTIVAPTLQEGIALRTVASAYVRRMEAENTAKRDAELRSSDLTKINLPAEDVKRITNSSIEAGQELIDMHMHQGGVVTIDNGVTAPVSATASFPTPEVMDQMDRTVAHNSKVDLIKTEMLQGAVETGAKNVTLVMDGQKVIGAYGTKEVEQTREQKKARQFEDLVLS